MLSRVRCGDANLLRESPGTSNIYEQTRDSTDGPPGSGLKYDWTTKEPTVLVPQPSDDPNDPLVCLFRSSRDSPRHEIGN